PRTVGFWYGVHVGNVNGHELISLRNGPRRPKTDQPISRSHPRESQLLPNVSLERSNTCKVDALQVRSRSALWRDHDNTAERLTFRRNLIKFMKSLDRETLASRNALSQESTVDIHATHSQILVELPSLGNTQDLVSLEPFLKRNSLLTHFVHRSHF